MRRAVFIPTLLAVAAALAQNPPKTSLAPVAAKTTAGSATTSKTKIVGPSAPVITIHGLCDSHGQAPGAKQTACATVLTRRDFEAFLGVLNATTTRGVDPPAYRNVAESYTALLVSANSADKAGVDKDPRFAQILDLTRLGALGAMYRVQQFKQALQVPAAEIEAYYKKNMAGYEEVDLERFLLPKNNPMNLSDVAFREKSKHLADELHARAVKGEDIAKLEKEGLEALGQKDVPLLVVGVRRGQMEDKADQAVFALGQGEVTPVLDEKGLWTFFERTGRRMLSLEDVKDEIRGKLFHERLDAVDKSLHDAVHVDYSEAYFGPSPHPAKSAGGAPAKAADSPAAVAPSDAVMTIHGLCGSNEQDSTASSCTLKLTRDQFETILKLTFLTASKTSPASPRSVAEGYVDTLIYGKAGERAGIEEDSRFPALMSFARKRALADMYLLRREEEARRISAQEIASFYKEHNPNFEELQLRHVSVPRDDPGKPADADHDAKAKKLANELRQRAVAGEDMDKLTQEAYEKLGKKSPPPSLMGPIRRGALEDNAEREVFALKPGQVSTVQAFPPSYVFYKLEKRRVIPLQEATPEISQILYQQRSEKLRNALATSVRAEYNEQYFRSVVHAGAGSVGSSASASPMPLSHPAKKSFTAAVQGSKP